MYGSMLPFVPRRHLRDVMGRCPRLMPMLKRRGEGEDDKENDDNDNGGWLLQQWFRRRDGDGDQPAP